MFSELVGSKLLKQQVNCEKNINSDCEIEIMASDDLWYLSKWLDQLVIANSESEKGDPLTKKRKKTGTDCHSMVSEFEIDEDADGELKQIIQAIGGIVSYSYNED